MAIHWCRRAPTYAAGQHRTWRYFLYNIYIYIDTFRYTNIYVCIYIYSMSIRWQQVDVELGDAL